MNKVKRLKGEKAKASGEFVKGRLCALERRRFNGTLNDYV